MKESSKVIAFDAGKWRHRVFLDSQLKDVDNKKGALRSLLEAQPEGTIVAIESTGNYHRLAADLAYQMGFTVYVLNARRTAAFKRADKMRGKSDNIDARFIARYVCLFADSLHPYIPFPQRLGRLRWLSKRRIDVASRKHDLQMSLRSSGLQSFAELEEAFDKLLAEIDAQMLEIAKEYPSYKRLLKIPGVGPVVAAGLLAVLEHYDFQKPDSFVAYCGLDPRPFESGTKVGKHKTSKFGDACLRRFLFLGAMSGQKCNAYKIYHQQAIDRGLKPMTSLMRIARKIAKLAWQAVKLNMEFQDEIFLKQLT